MPYLPSNYLSGARFKQQYFSMVNCGAFPFSRFLDNLRISGTSRYSTVYGLSNVSFCTLIMLMAFFVTDKEAKKFCERKFKLWNERMCMRKNQVHVLAPHRMNTGTRRRGVDANDIFVIDIV